ncbi:ribonuclease M5 [Weissella beninensis]|uniref:Ribonuclease M5 n=1 Tax=Periweissella beninensis TaxID=504936 RepID=A0ABT0VIG6_9LACO|nr:ribonuclease M5 [Periweissella beninensis]MBM7543902.1 ribonuclease M5 [Periweissella beninensis]MCM2437628.1 ribonuclease M5 [Periweissella beninensis]
MTRIQEVIVVEGKDDTLQLKKAVDADTIETNGSAVSRETLAQIKMIAQKRGIIIFTDPDFNGERIRKIVSAAVPNAKHAFIKRQDGVPRTAGGSLGVEHASVTTIREALANLYQESSAAPQVITQHDLLEAQLIGHQAARMRREQLGQKLQIGYSNAKQLLKRLQMFEIQKSEFLAAISEIDRGE